MEFDHLCGYHDKQNCIYGFAFVDDYERLFLARMITTSFLAHGVSNGRSHDLVQKKAVLRPRARGFVVFSFLFSATAKHYADCNPHMSLSW